MNGYRDLFMENPWEHISGPTYPDVNRLFRDDERFYISVNEKNEKLFVIQVPLIVSVDIPDQLKVVEIDIVRFDENNTRLLCTLTDENLAENFTLVVKDIAYRCEEYSDEQVISKAINRLFTWTELLKPSGRGIGKSQQMGLWGEMFILNEYMSRAHPIADAVNFWVGPEKKKQDFTLNHMALEVKTTMSGSTPTIKISSLEQLEKITDRLFLIHIFINKGNIPEALSLKDLFDQIMESINDDLETKTHFLHAVSKIYGKATEAEQIDKFIFLDYNLYEVDDNFPHIPSEDLPQAIRNVRYEIDSSKILDFKLDTPIENVITFE